jgi:hypothetical protein
MRAFLLAFKLMFLGCVFGAGFYTAWKMQDGRVARLEAAKIHDADQAAIKLADAEKRAAEATGRVVVKYVEQAAEIRWRNREVIREVPKFVSVEADRACVVPVGFIRLRNAAGACGGPVPEPSPGADDAPSGVALSAVAAADAQWAGQYCSVATQLESLQAWVTAQCEVRP